MHPRRILVATDFSENARVAARVAGRLARAPEDVVVAHVAPVGTIPAVAGVSGVGGPALPADRFTLPPLLDAEAAEAQVARWSLESGLEGARPLVATVGPPGAGIARVADEVGADLVVVSATGRSGFERVLLGSTATAVLHESRVDVLIARGPPKPEPGAPFQEILVATDLRDHAMGDRAAAFAAPLRAQGARVTLAHVRDRTLRGLAVEPDEAQRLLHAYNRRHFDGEARVVLSEGNPAPELRRIAKETRADLVAIGGAHGGALQRFVIGSVAESLASDAPASLLVLKSAHGGDQE